MLEEARVPLDVPCSREDPRVGAETGLVGSAAAVSQAWSVAEGAGKAGRTTEVVMTESGCSGRESRPSDAARGGGQRAGGEARRHVLAGTAPGCMERTGGWRQATAASRIRSGCSA